MPLRINLRSFSLSKNHWNREPLRLSVLTWSLWRNSCQLMFIAYEILAILVPVMVGLGLLLVFTGALHPHLLLPSESDGVVWRQNADSFTAGEAIYLLINHLCVYQQGHRFNYLGHWLACCKTVETEWGNEKHYVTGKWIYTERKEINSGMDTDRQIMGRRRQDRQTGESKTQTDTLLRQQSARVR